MEENYISKRPRSWKKNSMTANQKDSFNFSKHLPIEPRNMDGTTLPMEFFKFLKTLLTKPPTQPASLTTTAS